MCSDIPPQYTMTGPQQSCHTLQGLLFFYAFCYSVLYILYVIYTNSKVHIYYTYIYIEYRPQENSVMQENTISSLCHLLCLRSVPDRSYILNAFPYKNKSTRVQFTYMEDRAEEPFVGGGGGGFPLVLKLESIFMLFRNHRKPTNNKAILLSLLDRT